MTGPTTHEELTRLLREFMAGIREHVESRVRDSDSETLIERLLGGLAAVLSAVVALLPAGKRRDGLVAGLMTAAMRYLAKHPPKRNGD
jgi:hypothetical protein